MVVGGGILVGNITGFFRVAATAFLLGTHARADALAVAMGPLDTLNSVIVNTMIVGFVPMLMVAEGERRIALFRRCARVFALILAACSAAIALFAPVLVSILGPGLGAQQHADAIVLLRLMAPSTFFAGSAAIYAALLYTERRFVIPAIYQACLNGATIVVALGFWKVLGENGFPIGYVLGGCVQLSLTWYASRDLRRTNVAPAKVPLPEVLAKPSMFLLYAGMLALNMIVTRAFATHGGPGMAAAFDYTMRCVSVVIAYLVYPISNSLLPEIARLRGIGNTPQAYKLIDKSVAWMAAGAVLSCLAGIALRIPVITLLFERGNFTAESTRLVSGVFLGFAPSVIGWSLLDLISRSFFALDRPKLPAIAAFVPVTVNVIVMMALRSTGQLSDPAHLGWGASLGLLAGFGCLFIMIHVRKRLDVQPQPEPVASAVG